MRKYLFRGKRKDNGEWVYGDLIVSDGKYYIHPQSNKVTVNSDVGKMIVMHEVDPETVGQYIGLRDKNGNWIFDGDIMKYTPRPNCTIIYKVIWQQEWSRFALEQWSTHKYQLYEWAEHGMVKYCCEVIGNVHDNPELLEV